MKNAVVTLLAEKPCELSRFLKNFYNKDIIIDDTSFKWSCYYDSPIDTMNLLSTLMDNYEDYKIEAFLSLNKITNIKITEENINELIKFFATVQSKK